MTRRAISRVLHVKIACYPLLFIFGGRVSFLRVTSLIKISSYFIPVNWEIYYFTSISAQVSGKDLTITSELSSILYVIFLKGFIRT